MFCYSTSKRKCKTTPKSFYRIKNTFLAIQLTLQLFPKTFASRIHSSLSHKYSPSPANIRVNQISPIRHCTRRESCFAPRFCPRVVNGCFAPRFCLRECLVDFWCPRSSHPFSTSSSSHHPWDPPGTSPTPLASCTSLRSKATQPPNPWRAQTRSYPSDWPWAGTSGRGKANCTILSLKRCERTSNGM